VKPKIQTDRTNNKPHIVIRDNEKETCMLIDVAIPGDRNVIQKEAEKIVKCKDLTIEIQRMWNVKTKGDNSNKWSDCNNFKIIKKYVSTVPGNHEFKEVQKTVKLGTAHILRKALM
jgi:hypothetical protein